MKKLLSLLLVITMFITPLSVFATDENTTVTAYVTVSQYGEFAECSDGSEAVMGLSHPVEDGDFVDVAIYKSMYPDTEAYTKFDIYKAETTTGEAVELTLSRAGYDENWNTVFSPCEDAVITVNGADTGIVTDTDGKASLYFEDAGTYTVSAYKTKTVNEETIPAITAPVCIITVTEPEYITVIRNIAEKYSDSTITTDANMVWLIADIAVYNELYPDNEITFSEKVKQACIDKVISDADKATTPSALAKDILALRAMGLDARNVYNSKSKKVDVVEKLTALADAQDAAVTNIYTLPYVIIALRQGEGYATEEQMSYLIDSAISSREAWLNDEWGTDAITAMLLALAPYYNTNEEVKAVSDEALEIVKSAQEESGLIGNAASTGLAITALSAYGIDPMEMGIIDGLLTQATENLDGFEPTENSFSTEQGFRGLLARQLLATEAGHIMYDFSSYPTGEARSTKKTSSGGGGGGGGSYTPAVKDEDKTTEEKTEDKVEESVENTPNTDTKNPDVKVMPVSSEGKTFADISESKSKAEIEALAERGIINGKTETSFEPDATMTRAEFATIIARGLGLPEKAPAGFADVKADEWFYKYINTAYYYGIIKGVSDTEFNPNGVISRQEAAVMIARASKLCGMDTVITETDVRDILAVFTDYTLVQDWAKDSVAFCFDSGILSDEGTEITPAYKVTRAEVASMVYNMLEKSTLLQEDAK